VPVDDEISAARLGWHPAAKPARLRLVADSYGLDATARQQLVEVVTDSITRGGEFVRRRAEAGDPNFIKMWNEMGGIERFNRRRRWWAAHHQDFAAVNLPCAVPCQATFARSTMRRRRSSYAWLLRQMMIHE
jgi:hypothetical protein